MSLKIKVKVSEVTNLSDARYCAGMGVEMIGFSLDENHPKFIEISKAKEISSWICGIKMVGEFTGSNYKNVNYMAEQLNVEYIQLTHPLDLEALNQLHKSVIVKVFTGPGLIAETKQILDQYHNKVSYILLESEEIDSIETMETALMEWCQKYPILLGFGINIDQLDFITEKLKPSGIGLKGGDEIKPGLKNFDELSSILEKLEEE